MRSVVILVLLSLFITVVPSTRAAALADRLSGRILLQVESRGEAWYINPIDGKRYSLGRPADAFQVMRSFGLGISNTNLSKIPVLDGSIVGDLKLRKRLSGRILLQVESHGEAWYVNPVNLQRYFLGRPTDAFNLMRSLGLGITNADLALISLGGVPPPTPVSQAPVLPQPTGGTLPPFTPTQLSIRTADQVFPPSWIGQQVGETNFTDVRASKPAAGLAGGVATISDVKLRIFTETNLDYRLEIEWTVNFDPEASQLDIFKTDTFRLTGITSSKIVDQRFSTGGPRTVRIMYPNLEEDTAYVFRIQNCAAAAVGCLNWSIPYRTPKIGAANVTCRKIVDNGDPRRRLNLIFMARNYTRSDLQSGLFEYNVKEVLYRFDATATNVASRRSFFTIPVIAENASKFNVYVVNDEMNSFQKNQLISIGRRCGMVGTEDVFDKQKDIMVIMNNEESGTAYAQGIGTGLWVILARGHGWDQGIGTTLAHEMGHLIGLDEEYYNLEATDTFKTLRREFGVENQVPNCSYEEFSCTKWCSGTRADLIAPITTAKVRYDQCRSIFTSGNASQWASFCPTLTLQKQFEGGKNFYGARNQTELCAKPLSTLQAYVCYAGTFVPLEAENLGIGCQPGYGCYFGCGGYYKFMRPTYVSLMGGGALGENNRIYAELDQSSRQLPDISPAASAALRAYFAAF